ncbi:hypothetical protein D3P08_25930 [Paenibacillus nanensis]|uniref:Uncharacterized protein n=1 Tax=Paenibacillus nanensis TaxID=393251 RepID=A0A3A1UJH0_9BACL|nr:hypothetical protein [Paenibacillus nanensis]RIX46533.1 hypothetical protein D3P08_25930 [Paenibacillus nanensis]
MFNLHANMDVLSFPRGRGTHNKSVIRDIHDEYMLHDKKVRRIHTAWKLESGTIVVYEYMSSSVPPSSICFFEKIEDYNEACEEVSWLTTKAGYVNENNG